MHDDDDDDDDDNKDSELWYEHVPESVERSQVGRVTR
jgi:hypothetical protein